MDFTLFTIPAWAVTPEAQAWVLGFFSAALVRVFRAGVRWLKRVDQGSSDS